MRLSIPVVPTSKVCAKEKPNVHRAAIAVSNQDCCHGTLWGWGHINAHVRVNYSLFAGKSGLAEGWSSENTHSREIYAKFFDSIIKGTSADAKNSNGL
jgi:hypothetical protein